MTSVKLQYDDLMNPVLQANMELGGSGTNEEIDARVVEIARIPADQVDIFHNPAKGGMTEIEYRLMWTRTYPKKYGIIENSERGVWALTHKGSLIDRVDEKEVVSVVRELMKKLLALRGPRKMIVSARQGAPSGMHLNNPLTQTR